MQGRKKVVRELGFDPEIEKTTKVNRKAVRLARQAARLASGTDEIREEEVSSPHTSDDEIESMAGVVQPPRRTLDDYGQAMNGQNANLGFQPANPVPFDIKNTVLSALKGNQYSGAESECPNIHLSRFYDACGYTDPASISELDKRLRLFKLCLTGRAKDWIDTLPSHTITTWDELELKFLERYFPIHKFLEMRNDITNFEQGDSELLYDAWERFKICLKKYPKHGIDNHAQIQHFTQGLRAQTRMLLDASVGGSLKNKNESEAKELVEAMSQNEYRVQNDRGAKKKAGMLELDTQSALLAQSQLMNTQMAAMLKHFTTTLTLQMQANAVQDVTCNFCGQGHANGECFPASSEEAMYLSNFKKSSPNNNPYSNTYNPDWRDHPNFGWGGYQNQSQQQISSQNSQPRKPSQLEDALAQFIKVTQGNFEEMKISQNQLKANQEQMKANQDFAATQNNGFEGSTKDNPRNESCMAINLRSREVPSPEVVSKKKIAKKKGKGVEEKEGHKEKENSVHAKLPYPRMKKAKEEDPQQFKKFMKILHSLQMNIPFTEALEQMPIYAKFMKELLTKKQKPMDDDTVNMTEECSAIIQKKLPQKQKDPGRFTFPCSIGNLHVRRALCDLGASINFMPLSMMKRIPGAVAKPTKVQLSLADRSITYPHGILQNVLVRCAEFVFPTDFVILDIEEDAEVPLLLGRPFLATGRSLIEIEKGELMFRLDDEQVCFQVFQATKFGGLVPECFKVDVLKEVVKDGEEEEWDHEIELFLQQLDDCQERETLNLEGTLLVKEENKPSPPELPDLPRNGKHVLLGEDSKQPVIISNLFTHLEEDDFVKELKKDDDALVWGSDSINSAFCLHKTNKKEEFGTSRLGTLNKRVTSRSRTVKLLTLNERCLGGNPRSVLLAS
ncbi:hypothetical protein TSUD_242500 [Trifolium subterraneum]|uniref:Retrotransposon gag domain-containing protein n=1 Tax=Trifolium subterraneum TaxID=3900 RepID=A0A2Z6LUU3_TRISU|nr:hypothetical protein TSUD_242500 [Trifolium subterraneum]